MKIYTRTGDQGMTSIIGGKRLPKNHPRIEAYGTIDELIGWIGLLRAIDQKCLKGEKLVEIQSVLMSTCAVVATEPSVITPDKTRMFDPLALEAAIDEMEKKIPALTSFILPGGNQNAAFCNIARCVCRRAERSLIKLGETENVPSEIVKYINRLSDYLFVLTRCITYESGNDEISWKSGKSVKNT